MRFQFRLTAGQYHLKLLLVVDTIGAMLRAFHHTRCVSMYRTQRRELI
jgi:hypothetical protein